jgi:hypothetical protein
MLRECFQSVKGIGPLFPWNEKSGFPLFKTLIDVLRYLDSQFGLTGKGCATLWKNRG